jgi:hypothetical protein
MAHQVRNNWGRSSVRSWGGKSVRRHLEGGSTAVGTFWMDRLVKELPVGVDRLRQDRILEKALAIGADPLHLAHVFSLGAKASLRHTSAVTESEAEQAPSTR